MSQMPSCPSDHQGSYAYNVMLLSLFHCMHADKLSRHTYKRCGIFKLGKRGMLHPTIAVAQVSVAKL